MHVNVCKGEHLQHFKASSVILRVKCRDEHGVQQEGPFSNGFDSVHSVHVQIFCHVQNETKLVLLLQPQHVFYQRKIRETEHWFFFALNKIPSVANKICIVEQFVRNRSDGFTHMTDNVGMEEHRRTFEPCIDHVLQEHLIIVVLGWSHVRPSQPFVIKAFHRRETTLFHSPRTACNFSLVPVMVPHHMQRFTFILQKGLNAPFVAIVDPAISIADKHAFYERKVDGEESPHH